MEHESKIEVKAVLSMGEIFRFCVVMAFVFTILEPAPTFWERVFLCTIWISAGAFIGYLLRKIKLWQIARLVESQKARGP